MARMKARVAVGGKGGGEGEAGGGECTLTTSRDDERRRKESSRCCASSDARYGDASRPSASSRLHTRAHTHAKFRGRVGSGSVVVAWVGVGVGCTLGQLGVGIRQ